MYQYSNSLIRQFPSQVTGNAAVGVHATVYVGETNTLASLFEVNGSSKANPVTTDAKGFYSFSVADGDYRIVFSSSQFATLRISVLDGTAIREDFDDLVASNTAFRNEQQAAYDSFVLSQGWDQVGTFAAGFTFTSPNQVGQDSSGNWWRWNGAFNKVVTAGTLPSSDPNYKLVGDGVLRNDLAAGTADIGGNSASNLTNRANIENYGALTSASAATNAAAINSAISANGFAYVPKRLANFATNLTSSFDFSLLQGEGVVSVSSGATINLALTKSPIYNNQPMPLMARYYGGEAVKFVAYGDSIVESVGSTGHTANTGLSSFAPSYAWPTLLQHLARQQIGSGDGDLNFICGNAGYGGQRMDNGWSFDNFKSKVLDVYTGSQCLFLAFGHNDGNAAGFNTVNYIKQLKNMILLCRGNGIEPVILSTIPCGRPRGQDIYNEITSIQQQVCQELGVLFYDVYSKFKRLIDYYGYFNLITADGVHPTDKGYNSLACCIYSEVFRPLVHHGDDKLSLWEPQAKGLFYAGSADSAWSGDLSIYIENLSSVDLNIRYATAKGASAALAAVYHWCDSPKKQKLIYRAPFPAENVAAGTGMACQYARLTDGIFYTPMGITYTTIPDSGGRRRGVIDSSDMAFVVADEIPIGMSFIVLSTGSGNTSVAYAGHFEFTETTERSFYAAEANDRQGATRSQILNKGASLYRLPALASGVSYQLENENSDLTNIASFANTGTQITVNADLIESRGFVLMSGERITASGSGKWLYAIVRGLTGASTIADPTKIYLVRWQTGDAAPTVVATASVATAQPWTDIKFFISLDSSGDNYRIRVWDGLNSAATLLLTYTSTAVTNATTTRSECVPAAGVAGGGFAMGTVLGNEVPVLIKSFTVERFS